jgi:tetratricopeptide (TPR) repeat protein
MRGLQIFLSFSWNSEYFIVVLLIFFLLLTFVGYGLFSSLKNYRRSKEIVQFLQEGKVETFLEAIDSEIENTRSKSLKNVYKVNKSAGLSDLGKFKEALQLLEEVEYSRLPSKFKVLYVNNFLYILLQVDLERSRSFYEKFKKTFENPPRDPFLTSHLQSTLQVYRLKVEKNLETESFFQANLDASTQDLRIKAWSMYYLAWIAAQKGDAEKALQLYEKSCKLYPQRYLGSCPVVSG